MAAERGLTLKIAVFGGTGMIGSAVVVEARDRGHQVTSVSRSEPGEQVPGVTWLQGDVADAGLVSRIVSGHDVVVSATVPGRASNASHEPYLRGIENLLAYGDGAYVLIVGGFGSLLMPDGRPQRERPGGSVPKYRREAETVAKGLDLVRSSETEVRWTYLCPPFMIRPGMRSGSYRLGSDHPVGDEISTQDFAVAVLDEVQTPQHMNTRFTVAN